MDLRLPLPPLLRVLVIPRWYSCSLECVCVYVRYSFSYPTSPNKHMYMDSVLVFLFSAWNLYLYILLIMVSLAVSPIHICTCIHTLIHICTCIHTLIYTHIHIHAMRRRQHGSSTRRTLSKNGHISNIPLSYSNKPCHTPPPLPQNGHIPLLYPKTVTSPPRTPKRVVTSSCLTPKGSLAPLLPKEALSRDLF